MALEHTVTPDNAAAAPTIAYRPGMTPWQKHCIIQRKNGSKKEIYNLLSLRKSGDIHQIEVPEIVSIESRCQEYDPRTPQLPRKV